MKNVYLQIYLKEFWKNYKNESSLDKNAKNIINTTNEIMKFLIVLSTLFLQGMSQNLCGMSQNTPLCANQFNGNYINCYCVFDPISKTMTRQTAISQSSTDLNLCQNLNQNTFCCPYNFLDRSNTFVFNGFVYDKMCNSIGLYTPPSVTSLLTTNVEAFVTLYITPDTLTNTQILPIITSTITPTVTMTQILPTVITSTMTKIVPTLITSTITEVQVVPTTTTEVQVVPTTTTFVSTEFVYPTQTTIAQLAIETSRPTITKTIIRTKIVRKTICHNKV